MSERVKQSLENLNAALRRLEEGLREPSSNPLLIDGVIQRFEFTFELFWKTLKRALESQGQQTATPREALEFAFRAGWLDSEERWLQMLKDRNASSHTYNEDQAREIYSRIKENYSELARASALLSERFG